jgi:hypothetical protein
MIQPGMPIVCGRWHGTVWRVQDGYCFSLEDSPLGFPCDYRVHPIGEVVISKGIVIAPPQRDLSRQKIARTWKAADVD